MSKIFLDLALRRFQLSHTNRKKSFLQAESKARKSVHIGMFVWVIVTLECEQIKGTNDLRMLSGEIDLQIACEYFRSFLKKLPVIL